MTPAPHLPRSRYDLCDWQEWSRPDPRLARIVEMRHAVTGMPVPVLVPTLLGRVVTWWRLWREAR
jgi:hypothetical protein